MFSHVFFYWVEAFPHAQIVEVVFPFESRAHRFRFWDVVFPAIWLAVVPNYVWGPLCIRSEPFPTVVCV